MTPEQVLAEARRLHEAQDPTAALGCLHEFLRRRALPYNAYMPWGQLIETLADAAPAVTSLARIRTAIVGSYTTAPVANAVRCALLGEGGLADVYEGALDAYRQEILDPASGLHAFRPEFVLLALDWRTLIHRPREPVDAAGVEAALTAEVADHVSLWAAAERLRCPVVQHVLDLPDDGFIGDAERFLAWSPAGFVAELNRRLRAAAPSFVRWLDVEALAARVGRRNWFDSRMYHHGRLGFSLRHLPDYAAALLGAWRALSGRTRKCLVVDLDNTLWGGVVGDDGLEGIVFGPGTADGEAFADFGEYLRELKSRGVILAICSKNDHRTAMAALEKHPHLRLRPDDFGAIVCNWQDKAGNLRRIARELNIDLGALVFVDDDAAECELVRRECREVAVVHLPSDPALYRRHVDGFHYFDAAVVSTEDLQRAASYAARRKAAELEASSSDLAGYLTGLGMVGDASRPSDADVPRLAQMELKTNQFNLTARRYSDIDWKALLHRDDAVCLALRLADRFADHGLVASLVGERRGRDLHVASWLMSCRVFSRTAEEFMMNRLVGIARELGIATIVGEYRPTEKNRVVERLYARLGFAPAPGDDGRWWTLDVARAAAAPLTTYIQVRAG